MNKKNRLLGTVIASLLLIAGVLFMTILIKTKLLPAKLLLLAGGAFLVYAVLVFLLTRNPQKRGAMICGCVMTVVMLLVLILGFPYLTQALDMLDAITQVEVEITDMGVYVKEESPAKELKDLTGGRIGIMDVLDRENTDEALENVYGKIGTLQVQEYAGLGQLISGLFSEEVDAILINSAYLDILTEMEGFENAADQLREIHMYQAQTQIQVPVKQPEEPEEKKDILDFLIHEETEETKPEHNYNVFTVYISGIDSRRGLISKSRSDVNIIATVNVDTRQVLLVSTPRDFYVPLPISGGKPDKLTHAGIYGIDVSMGTLEMLYGTDIDYYFRVNFSGFEKIIDALGGVTVYSDYSFRAGGKSFQKGNNNLNGHEALAFARERKSFASGDRQRGKNQMAVIKAVIEKAMSPSLLTNFSEIMQSVSGSFETSMPYDKIAELVREQLENGGSWNVVTCSVDGTGDSKIPYSMNQYAYVMIPDQSTVDTVIAKINQVKNGEILN